MPSKREKSKSSHTPVLDVTRYDKVAAWLIALVVGISLAASWEVALHFINRPAQASDAVAMEFIEVAGGSEDGAIDETLLLESPAEETADPSLAEVESEEVEVQELLDNVIDLADQAVEQTNRQLELDAVNAGKPGSASGTGRRALGIGDGQGGLPRDQRWFFRYDDQITLDEYARRLDHFGVVLGVIQGKELAYVSNFSKARPDVKRVKSGEGEKRLYLTWQGGGRRAADAQLFKKAGIDVTGLSIFQFVPGKLENKLAQLEREYQNRPAEQIRRTYFVIKKAGTGYNFVVTRQILFR
ncbi:hypothetical protein [Symmachiella dynata]|uniref:hypothetical protein n=1 Tax=Symmachiella dynata TaxID=2527995 RepID=UPI0030ED986C